MTFQWLWTYTIMMQAIYARSAILCFWVRCINKFYYFENNIHQQYAVIVYFLKTCSLSCKLIWCVRFSKVRDCKMVHLWVSISIQGLTIVSRTFTLQSWGTRLSSFGMASDDHKLQKSFYGKTLRNYSVLEEKKNNNNNNNKCIFSVCIHFNHF